MKDQLIITEFHDGYKWHWKSAEDESGYCRRYWTTDADGEGIFIVDLKENSRTQILGTCDFSVVGLKDPKAKIRRWANAQKAASEDVF